MSEVLLPRHWKEEFERAAAARREDALYREQLARVAIIDRHREEAKKEKDRREQVEAQSVLMEAFAAPERVTAFRVRLDGYDAATVDALMDNQVALDAVRDRLDRMRARAHVLPDGRRVFVTEDGQRIFDEQGQAVAREELDPAHVDPTRPRWEAYQAERRDEDRLLEERRELHDYQARLDRARDRLDRGEISQADLDRMESSLSGNMPEAVRQRLERDRQQPAASQDAPDRAPALPDNIDALMRQTGPAAPAPSL